MNEQKIELFIKQGNLQIYIQLPKDKQMLTNNPTQMDSYNKHAKPGQGTLMANWFEERVHRQQKGNGRAVTRTHFPKKHQQLLQSQGFNARNQEDDTKYRVLGSTNYGLGTTQNYHYGKAKNKADTFASVGPKTKMTQEQVLRKQIQFLKKITADLENEQRKKIEQQRKGQFESTHMATYIPKPLDANQVGRLIMRDQNGALVGLENVDQDLRESNKFIERGQISKDEDLRRLIDIDHGYERSEPITFWKQKLQDGTFYMSNPGKTQSFGKKNQFLKTFKHYKHYHD